MAVTRLAFETGVAYWKKIHKANGDVQHFRIAKSGKDAGLARARKQTSYAAASTHKEPKTHRLDRHKFTHFQGDQSDKFTSYDDAVKVGYTISPSISFNGLKESMTSRISIADVFSFIEKRYKELHKERTRYQGIFWSMQYIINYEDMAKMHYWNSAMYSTKDNISFWIDDYHELQENLMEAWSTYNDVIIQSVHVNFRKDHLEL